MHKRMKHSPNIYLTKTNVLIRAKILMQQTIKMNSLGFSAFNKAIICVGVAILLSGCAQFRGPAYQLAEQDKETFGKPMRAPKEQREGANESITGIGQTEAESDSPNLSIIKPPMMSVADASSEAQEMTLPKLSNTQVTRQTYNNLPLPVFINEAYGNQLGLDFIIQPSVRQAPDLVTLRLNSLLSQKDFYVLVSKTLANYGITIFERDNVLVFDYSADASPDSAPIIVTGQALPEVPSESRPIFYIYPLKALRTPELRGLLSAMFPKKDVEISEDMTRNALIISGKLDNVRQAVEAAKLFDRAPMSGMYNAIFKPKVGSIVDLAFNLEQVLKSEGFSVRDAAGPSAIKLLPLESTGQLIVFTKSQDVLDYIIEWAERLEFQEREDVQNGVFTYQVRNTQAVNIVQLLSTLGLAQGNFAASDSSNRDTGSTSSGMSGSNRSASSSRAVSSANNIDNAGSNARFAVDEQLNTILFSGSGKDWVRALSMIEKLDRPVPSVMIEVILAEVSLEESEESAIEWLFKAAAGRFDMVGSTLGSLGVSGGGFNLNLSNSGETRAALNFLYDNSRSTIRSRPRLMVKSGGEASINIGDRVPIITQTATSSLTEALTQSVSYVETGVILGVKPIVHASGMVDIEINQELSEAISTESSAINSPTIRTRNIQTTLSLRDGGSVLIGGLIRSNDGGGERGVPVLGKLPIIGNLFKGRSSEVRRTELMIMIIPYILNSPDEAESLVDELQESRIRELGGV